MFAYPSENPVVFVKHGGPEKQAEADTQRLAFDWLDRTRETNDHNIYIPEIYYTFTRGRETFIVTEYIHATTLYSLMYGTEAAHWDQHRSNYFGIVAEAIQLLHQMPVPRDAAQDPYTKSRRRIKHCLFKDQQAPVDCPTVKELEDHLKEVWTIK